MSEPNAEPQAEPDVPEPAADEPEIFANRAARRAKGKTSKPAVFTKGNQPAGRGSVQSPRQYGNRRSG
jgi:hypothetical protein